MSKALVDRTTGVINGTFDFPLDFSISGKYIVDIPTSLGIKPLSNYVPDLITAKVAAYKALHPALIHEHHDELITSPNVDTAQSSRYSIGQEKRTAILPGGSIVTNVINLTSPATKVFIHWYGFTIYSDPGPNNSQPDPSRVLYNYDIGLTNFSEFPTSAFIVAIRNSANSSTIATVNPDIEQSVSLSAANYRLRFTNSSSDKTYFLSDWIWLHD
jgi:hypothetical protein